MLRRLISLSEFEKLLKDLGFETVVRGSILEARKGDAKLKARLEGDKLRIETSDYGESCLRDYDAIYKDLVELDAKPEAIYLMSPYIYSYEKKRGITKKLLKKLGIEANEIYSGYCG
jgi:hypothetical protein